MTKPERSYRLLFWFLALVGVAADQASKYGVFDCLGDVPSHQWVLFHTDKGGFQLVAQFDVDAGGQRKPHVNQGALFGFGRQKKELANTAFAVISLLAAVAIVVWSSFAATARDGWLCGALGLILGGTLGNFYDRVVLPRRARLPALELPVRLAGVQHRRLLPGVRRRPAADPGLPWSITAKPDNLIDHTGKSFRAHRHVLLPRQGRFPNRTGFLALPKWACVILEANEVPASLPPVAAAFRSAASIPRAADERASRSHRPQRPGERRRPGTELRSTISRRSLRAGLEGSSFGAYLSLFSLSLRHSSTGNQPAVADQSIRAAVSSLRQGTWFTHGKGS